MMLAHAGVADEGLSVAMLVGAAWLGWIGWRRLRGRGFARIPRPAAIGLIVAALVIAAASTVVPRAAFGPGTSTSGPRIASTATLTFREPREGTTVTDDQLEVVLDLADGTVIDDTAGSVTPDTGHIHLSVDGTLVSMSYGTIQVVDLAPFGAGVHTVEAEFVAADHLPFAPPVVATTTIDRETPA